ncbi:Pyrrolysine--tRNA ligase [Frankliniella fusca]|uniref:Pyrrolysine--tRNA ligase n=1 Tax=Frankliniella fusca TaxID=407009 RepID=A0AAE1LFK2_9NEOP|nr:Pyrrolysine--tRNA ligase [Frankliniella fusca]
MEKEKQSRQRHNCCVPQCHVVKTEDNHLHYLPKDPTRRKAWAIAIKTGKSITDTMQVCSKHFLPEDYIKTMGKGKRLCLKPTAVPSQNLPIRSITRVIPSPVKRRNLERADRARKRDLWTVTSFTEEGGAGDGDKGKGCDGGDEDTGKSCISIG